jgi:deazaflavin-dependent oxidoreductase (nitroreductase family)
MTRPPINWTLLAEEPDVELVLGQIACPWEPSARSGPPVAPDVFASFDQPGFAKIVLSLRVRPHGAGGTLLTVETRVALTDRESLRRFRRYWMLIGPFSGLIRRIALRMLAADLRQSTAMPRLTAAPGGRHERQRGRGTPTEHGVRPLPLSERIKMRVEHEIDTRSVGFAAWLLRVTRGRVARLWHRRVLLLTTHGRRTGRARTVPLQYFPDGEALVVVAANSGMPSPPAWYFNLMAEPRARVEVLGRTLPVRSQELSAQEAAAFWPRVLAAAPDYARYPQRTNRRLPLLRLVPSAVKQD